MKRLIAVGILLCLIAGVACGQEEKPPVDYIVNSAEYKFNLDDDGVECAAMFGVTVFPSDKFVQVPVLKDEISPESVCVNGKVQDLTPIGGWLAFLPKETGSYSMEVKFSLKPEILKGIRYISFATPVSAVNRMSIESGKPWFAGSNRLPYRIEAGGIGEAVAILPGEELRLQWEDVPVKVERPPLFNVSPDVFYLFEGPTLYVSAKLETTIYAGKASGVNLVLPPDAKKIEIHGTRVKSFTQEGMKTTVDFKGGIEGKADIFVSFSLPFGNGRDFLRLPIPSVQEARISGGTIAISCPSDSDLMVENVSQVEEIALYDIPVSLKALMSSQPVRAFQIKGDSPQLSVKPVFLKPAMVVEAVADRADFISFRSPTGEEIVKVSLLVRNDRRQFLRISLPEGTQIGSCSVSGNAVVPGHDGDNADVLLPVERSIETLEGIVSFPVEFVYFTKNPAFDRKGSASLVLPSIDIPIARATWVAYLPMGIKVMEVSGNVAHVKEFVEAAEKLEYGRGYIRPAAVAEEHILGEISPVKTPVLGDVPMLGMAFRPKLVENYWSDATEAYKRQDYEEAERNLKIILEKYPGNDFINDARQLMDNVSLALKPQDQERLIEEHYLPGKRLQKQMVSYQFGEEVEQQELIEKAEEAELKGEGEKSIALMEKAKEKSETMLKRGVPVAEQKAVMKEVSAKLEARKKEYALDMKQPQSQRGYIAAAAKPLVTETHWLGVRAKSSGKEGGLEKEEIFFMQEEDFNGLVPIGETLSEDERKKFMGTFVSNVEYSYGSPLKTMPAAPAPTEIIDGAYFFSETEQGIPEGGGVKFSGRQAEEAAQLLANVSRQKGRTVNLSISANNKISNNDVTAVGGVVNSFAGGYYAILDKAQKETLEEIRKPDISEPRPVRLSKFLVGNTTVLPNQERVSLPRSEGVDNVFVLGDKEIRLNANQLLLVATEKGTNILSASQAVGFGEVLPEIKVKGQGFTFDVPRIGNVHLFEKLLLQPGEKPQVLIEYEGKGESI